MPLPVTDPASRRNLMLALLLATLLVVPTVLGFAVAGAGESRPPSASDPPAGSTITRDAIPLVDQSELISEAPLANAPSSATDALTRQGEEALGIPRITFISDATGSIRVENGGAVALADGYAIAVTIDPYPPDSFDLAVRLEVLQNGIAVPGARIDTRWDMTLMTHGPFETVFPVAADGVFEHAFDFFMFGPWYVDTTVFVPEHDPLEFRLSIYVWPA